MKARRNTVPFPPSGLVVAVQYWDGDEAAAMRLARLMADIEPEKRDDVVLALCRRHDTRKSQLAVDTYYHCARKFRVLMLQSPVVGEGHPDGANALWSGTFQELWSRWQTGNLSASSAFFTEADGVPIRRDWLTSLKQEHETAVLSGKLITGAVMSRAVPHVNGNLIAHLSLWADRRSLHDTPAGQAWDMFHAAALLRECHPTSLIRNVYGSTEWTAGAIESMRFDTVYLANVKDDSAIEWAERELLDEVA